MADPGVGADVDASRMPATPADTDLATGRTVFGDAFEDARSAIGRTATFSTTGVFTTSFENRPVTATTPSERADPISPATTATAQTLETEPSTAVAAPGAGAIDAPSSDGWRHSRSSGGSGLLPIGASSS